ncbi:hypothetical protein ABZP36_016291 [Zizania latifolia]
MTHEPIKDMRIARSFPSKTTTYDDEKYGMECCGDVSSAHRPSLFVGLAVRGPADQDDRHAWSYHLPLLNGISGAESLAFDGKGGLYTGVSDGRVLNCSSGVAAPLAGAPSRTMRTTGRSLFARRPRFNGEITMNADATGRLLKYDAWTGRVTVLKAELSYPNGVVVSRDSKHLIMAHMVSCQAFRYWLKGSNTGEYELFTDLPGYPDNVRRDCKGGHWVALNQERMRLGMVPPTKHLFDEQLNPDGVEVELTAAKGITLSEVADRKLWLGSAELDYLGVFA